MDDQEKTELRSPFQPFKIQESDDCNLLDEWITKKYSNLGLTFEPLEDVLDLIIAAKCSEEDY